MEQGFFPYRITRDGVQVIQTYQLALLKIIEQRGAVSGHAGKRQVDSQFATLFNPQAGGLQQMAAPDSSLPPEVDQLIGPTGRRRTEPLDITQRRGVGAGIEVGEGGIVAQTDAERQLDGFHGWLGGSAGA